ncbi:oligosaccharide flippase family protein [Thalassotalea profundi]|uniref:Polysaccharide biosynthesis protein C-terminal domain-containing protein n=1 Tax=Thalassotalea profundi TaxID=2036687 RepID=A0ABQ3IU86_9GAMM|nr:polysaccharide biosynthesis C-terminal domain-containing protein [Thalassotalea profundi]GHE89423.1 hypothetical protein GCM10011501_18710 [Thalassotalea profundi]
MSTKKLFLKSSVFRFIERIILVVSSLLLTPYFINVIGAEGYGFWLLILSIIGWFNIIELGFPSAVQRHTILALEKDNPEAVNTVFSTSVALFGCLGLAATALLAGVGIFSSTFFGETVDADALKLALFVLSAKILMDFLMNPFHGFITAFLRLDIDSNLVILNVIIKSVLIFLLIPTLNIWGAIIATLFSDVLTNGLKIYYIKKLYPKLSFNFKYVSKDEIKSLFAFSKHVVANGIANTLNSKADPFIVTKLIGLSSVAVYGVANRLAEHIKSFVFTVNGFLSPVFMRKMSKNESLDDLFHNAIMINLFFACVFSAPLIILGKAFIILWVGDEFAPAANILYFLIFTFFCQAIYTSVNQVLLAQAQHKYISLVSLFGAITNISLSIILGLKYGLIGVAVGTSIGSFIANIVLSLWLYSYYNKLKLWLIIRKLFLANVLVFGVGLYIAFSMTTVTWFELVLYGAVSFVVFLILSWLLVLDSNLRKVSGHYFISISNKLLNKL